VTGHYQIKTEEEEATWLGAKRKAEEGNPKLKPWDYYYGLPQGSPLSPLLSILTLNRTLLKKKSGYKVVQYADDGLIYDIRNPSQFQLRFPAALAKRDIGKREQNQMNQKEREVGGRISVLRTNFHTERSTARTSEMEYRYRTTEERDTNKSALHV
jgi:Reverse transcriptase (RNA-dependent DNA polymerase)